MPRRPRSAPGGHVYHVLNRAAGRMKMLRTNKDFAAMQALIGEALERCPTRILAYCLMPSHWHFVVWPRKDGELTAFFRWLTHTHAMRWRVAHRTVGYGHLYQGRFKCFPVQPDGPSLRHVGRYVERNALSVGLVPNAEDWPWASLFVRLRGSEEQQAVLSPWPEPLPADWTRRVNAPLPTRELERLKRSIERSRPFGDEAWTSKTISRLGLQHTIRPEGRPPKNPPRPKQQPAKR